jgi:hypothetical protein
MAERLIGTTNRHDFQSADLLLVSEVVRSTLCYCFAEFQPGINFIRSRRCAYLAFSHLLGVRAAGGGCAG